MRKSLVLYLELQITQVLLHLCAISTHSVISTMASTDTDEHVFNQPEVSKCFL